MSNAENIIVSLEWAKKLKAAGWPPLGQYFCAVPEFNDLGYEYRVAADNQHRKDAVPTPSAEEILHRLPGKIHCHYVGNAWSVDCNGMLGLKANTLANAAAACYCYLAAHKLLPQA